MAFFLHFYSSLPSIPSPDKARGREILPKVDCINWTMQPLCWNPFRGLLMTLEWHLHSIITSRVPLLEACPLFRLSLPLLLTVASAPWCLSRLGFSKVLDLSCPEAFSCVISLWVFFSLQRALSQSLRLLILVIFHKTSSDPHIWSGSPDKPCPL